MKVLVVEDEETVAEYLKRILESEHHEVDIAYDGMSGYEKAANMPYDVIILDIILPFRSGDEVCADLRDVGIATPILMLSSRQSEASRVNGLDSGADDYMVKPFSPIELCARLRALKRRPQSIEGGDVYIDVFHININKHRVWLAGQEVVLRSNELLVLEYLVKNYSRVITRTELLKRVWGISGLRTSNRVDACIKRLRQKIGHEYVVTVYKVGYKIKDFK